MPENSRILTVNTVFQVIIRDKRLTPTDVMIKMDRPEINALFRSHVTCEEESLDRSNS